MRRLVYISAPFTAGSQELVQANIERACAYGSQVRALGAVPLVPHAAVLPFPALSVKEAWGPAMQECLRMLSACDAMILCPGWEASKGCRVEYNQALAWGIPVYFAMSELREFVGRVA
jgi:hypothetical protein